MFIATHIYIYASLYTSVVSVIYLLRSCPSHRCDSELPGRNGGNCTMVKSLLRGRFLLGTMKSIPIDSHMNNPSTQARNHISVNNYLHMGF